MSSDCGVCGELCAEYKADQLIKYSGGCDRHFHVQCVFEELDGKKTRSTKDSLKYKDCRSQSAQSSTRASASTALTKDFLITVMEGFKKEVFGELKSYKSEMLELSSSVQFVSDKLDTSNSLMTEVKAELHADNYNLYTDVCHLKERLRQLE